MLSNTVLPNGGWRPGTAGERPHRGCSGAERARGVPFPLELHLRLTLSAVSGVPQLLGLPPRLAVSIPRGCCV